MLDAFNALTPAILTYMIGLYIICILIINAITNNNYSPLTLILGPIVAGVVANILKNIIIAAGVPIAGIYLQTFYGVIFGIVMFFIFGFDKNRHNSNTLSLGLMALVAAIVIHAILQETDLAESILMSIEGLVGTPYDSGIESTPQPSNANY
ncbi:MAG: hypothetical protein AAGF06_02535 [Pseudomonadota bacterium]